MGSGKTIVEFFSADIVFRVCKEAEVQFWTPSFTKLSHEERQLYFTHGRGEHKKSSRINREIALEKWNTDFGSIGN